MLLRNERTIEHAKRSRKANAFLERFLRVFFL